MGDPCGATMLCSLWRFIVSGSFDARYCYYYSFTKPSIVQSISVFNVTCGQQMKA